MKGINEITNDQNVIDSRDIIARIKYLEGEKETASQEEGFDEDLYDDTDEGSELKMLLVLQDEASSSSDWTYGETLIRDTYFEEYAQELAEDCGMIDRNAKWPVYHIDWEAAAETLKQDYMSVDFAGVDYWIRA